MMEEESVSVISTLKLAHHPHSSLSLSLLILVIFFTIAVIIVIIIIIIKRVGIVPPILCILPPGLPRLKAPR